MIYQPRGPEFVNASIITGWRAAIDADGNFTDAELARLARPLPFEGGPARYRPSPITMQGQYVITFDLSGHTLPAVDIRRTHRIRPYLYVTGTPAAIAALRPQAYDPVPSNQSQDRLARLLRVRPGGLYTATLVDAAAGVEPTVTITIPVGVQYSVARVLGRIEADRFYWSEPELD